MSRDLCLVSAESETKLFSVYFSRTGLPFISSHVPRPVLPTVLYDDSIRSRTGISSGYFVDWRLRPRVPDKPQYEFDVMGTRIK